ncbi:PF04305 family protein [Leptospira alexanderi serovar Manhao 3 str. L 60]|uniref:PF04305 family protein n=2 Tax=Leptospiraceae TaxID=170 RepID=V6I8W5_9LEPT|nr:PF04305 family protein [Leptospira alexanderi serovar Manhao 3 str. L 60]
MAIELFAWAILKFQDAASSVRFGLYRTLLEEQTHLRMYLSEMKKGGMELGDRPLNSIFWKQVPRMQTLEKFYAIMAISFEGANLDFSKIYTMAFERFKDLEKANIMKKVYEDEIKHVRRGYHYVKKRIPDSKDEWDYYLSLIEFPFTPRRAKGYHYFPETRIQAGFSEEFATKLGRYEDEYTGKVNSRILKEVLDLS